MIKRFLKYHPIHKKIAPYLDAIFLLQPTWFFLVWVIPVLGMISAQMINDINPLWNTGMSWRVFFVFFGLTFLIGSTFIATQINLSKDGKGSLDTSPIDKYISIEDAESIAKKICLVGLLAIIVSQTIGIIPIFFAYYILKMKNNYSLYEWRGVPIASCLINTFIGLLFFILGWTLVVKFNHDNGLLHLLMISFKYILPYLLVFLSILLMVTIKGIRNSDNLDSSVSLSSYEFNSLLFIPLLLVSIGLYFSIINIDPLSSTVSIVSLPFFIFVAFRKLDKDILRAIYYPIFLINFFSLIYYPWLFVPIFITYFISKYYYWHRFNLHYPTFIVDND